MGKVLTKPTTSIFRAEASDPDNEGSSSSDTLLPFNKLHIVPSQKTKNLILTVVRTSNLKSI
jgi:hypothetical protein